MSVLKRFTKILPFILLLCLSLLMLNGKSNIIPTSADPSEQISFIIDAGHGGLTNTIKV